MAFSPDVPHEHGSCRAVVVLGLVEDRGNVLAHLSVILHGSHIVSVHGQQMARAGASTDEVEVKEQSRFRPLVLREIHVGDSGSARPGARDPAHRAGSVHVGGARAARRDLVRTATRRDSEHTTHAFWFCSDLSALNRHPAIEELYVTAFREAVRSEFASTDNYLRTRLGWEADQQPSQREEQDSLECRYFTAALAGTPEVAVVMNDWSYAIPHDAECVHTPVERVD